MTTPKLSQAQIKLAHENAMLQHAIAEHNRVTGRNYAVIDRPEPPDAILEDGFERTWMEVTDAFHSAEWARHLNTYNSIKGHVSMARGPYIGMDEQLAVHFCDLLEKKASKTSYHAALTKYGPGILAIGIQSPWIAPDSLDEIRDEWRRRGAPSLTHIFAHVYIYDPSKVACGKRVFQWQL